MYFAHSSNREGSPAEPLEEHLRLVAARAARYAKFFGAEKEANVIGLLHDLGKYSASFQRRLVAHVPEDRLGRRALYTGTSCWPGARIHRPKVP